MRLFTLILVCTMASAILSACGGRSAPVSGAPDPFASWERSPAQAAPARAEVVLAALGHIDAPYRFGGNDGRGLDCSALVQRAYREAGLEHVPRTTAEQARAARRVATDHLQPGDVLFFSVNGSRIDHVGLFIGDGRFIHAPSTRGQVRIEPLASSYWQPRLRKVGHFFE